MLLGLALAGWMAGSIPARAQNIPLLTWGSNWKFVDSGTNLLTTWKTNNYVETSPLWQGPAPGLFGYEDDAYLYAEYGGGIVTPLQRYVSYPNGNTTYQVTNYYFRTTFNWSGGSPTNYYLVASNAFDDGVIVYLNGMQLYTIRATANSTATTYATTTGIEGSNEVVNLIPATRLRYGANLVAAELRQAGTASSDAVFGLALTAVPYVQLKFTTNPVSKSVSAGTNVTLTASASGSSPYYFWYRFTTNASGAYVTNLVDSGLDADFLTFSSVSVNNAGTYFVVATNNISRVQSTNAVLTVKMDPISITQQPHYLDLIANTRASFSVEVKGSMPAGQSGYRWWKITDVPIATNIVNGVTVITYKYNTNSASSVNTNEFWLTASTGTLGRYYVVITNALMTLTSDVVRLRLVPDVFGPMLESAVVEKYSPDILKVTFTENVLTNKDPFSELYLNSPWNEMNYLVTTLDTRGTNLIPVPVIQVTNVTSKIVYLKIGTPWNRNTNYMLSVSGVADRLTNAIAPNSWIPIAFQETTNVVAWKETYRFASTVGIFDADAYTDLIKTNDPIAWTKLNYDDSSREPYYNWDEGTGAFGKSAYGTYPAWNCTSLSTFLTEGASAHYYRNRFTLGIGTNLKNISDITAVMSYVIDDGAIFYINGKEVKRVNMPTSGVVTYTTLANSSAGAATCITNQSVDVDGIVVNGNNVFAIEVHQVGRPDPDRDVYFDASLNISWLRTPTPPTETNAFKISKVFDMTNKTVQVFSTNKMHNLAIDVADSIEGPWLQAQPASTNMTFQMTDKVQYFRLRNYR